MKKCGFFVFLSQLLFGWASYSLEKDLESLLKEAEKNYSIHNENSYLHKNYDKRMALYARSLHNRIHLELNNASVENNSDFFKELFRRYSMTEKLALSGFRFLTNLESIRQLKNLTSIGLGDMPAIRDLRPLYDLVRLQQIYFFSGMTLEDKEIRALSRNFPAIRIMVYPSNEPEACRYYENGKKFNLKHQRLDDDILY